MGQDVEARQDGGQNVSGKVIRVRRKLNSEAPALPYDQFAWFYDRHWAPEVADDFLAATNRLILPELSGGARILDLCCGTGQLAAELSERGFQVTGVDVSPNMLDFARQRSPEVEFVQQDVREPLAATNFDAVVCLFDSINHFLNLAEVEAVFRTARAALRPGGLFLFDVNTDLAFREHWEEYYSIVEPEEVCVLSGLYDEKDQRAHYDLTMFRLTDGAWVRSDTRIEERCYDLKELEAALKNAGFEQIHTYSADADLELTDHTGRVFFLCS